MVLPLIAWRRCLMERLCRADDVNVAVCTAVMLPADARRYGGCPRGVDEEERIAISTRIPRRT
jgi:hypothetical protein